MKNLIVFLLATFIATNGWGLAIQSDFIPIGKEADYQLTKELQDIIETGAYDRNLMAGLAPFFIEPIRSKKMLESKNKKTKKQKEPLDLNLELDYKKDTFKYKIEPSEYRKPKKNKKRVFANYQMKKLFVPTHTRIGNPNEKKGYLLINEKECVEVLRVKNCDIQTFYNQYVLYCLDMYFSAKGNYDFNHIPKPIYYSIKNETLYTEYVRGDEKTKLKRKEGKDLFDSVEPFEYIEACDRMFFKYGVTFKKHPIIIHVNNVELEVTSMSKIIRNKNFSSWCFVAFQSKNVTIDFLQIEELFQKNIKDFEKHLGDYFILFDYILRKMNYQDKEIKIIPNKKKSISGGMGLNNFFMHSMVSPGRTKQSEINDMIDDIMELSTGNQQVIPNYIKEINSIAEKEKNKIDKTIKEEIKRLQMRIILSDSDEMYLLNIKNNLEEKLKEKEIILLAKEKSLESKKLEIDNSFWPGLNTILTYKADLAKLKKAKKYFLKEQKDIKTLIERRNILIFKNFSFDSVTDNLMKKSNARKEMAEKTKAQA